RSHMLEWLALVAGLTLLCTALAFWQNLPGIRDVNRRAYDLSMQAVHSPPASRNIVIITIDDASIDALGYWPWRRSVHAALLDHLHGARAVALDLILSAPHPIDRKSTRLNSSHVKTSYAVFCLKKKK